MAAYDPSPNAVLIKQFRTGSNNYYENIELSGSSVLVHTDITGSVTGSNFTLAADTGSSYSILVYQDNAFKLAASIGGTGTSGVSGAQGAIGVSGTSGVQGAQGASGGTGTSGVQGAQGASGTSGITGTSGIAGTSGVQGAQGATGTSGITGTSGVAGTSGVKGATGSQGAAGTSGVQGAQGASGFGTSGVQGAQGASGSGTSGVQGAQGAQGAAGTGGGASMVYRTLTTNSANIIVAGLGSQTDLDNASITFTGGNTVTFSSLGSLRLYTATVTYAAGTNTTATFSFVYPDLNGQTTLGFTQMPIVAYYNNASPAVIQGNTLWNVSNSSGTVTVQKTGLTGNPAANWKIIF